MKIKILGAHGLESDRTRFMSILLDEVLAMDSGALAFGLSLPAQKIKSVLLTHSHLDHTIDTIKYLHWGGMPAGFRYCLHRL